MKCSRPRSRLLRVVAALSLFASSTNAPALAQDWILPPHFETLPLTHTFTLPTGMAFAPDGSMAVIEKIGRVNWVNAQGVWQFAAFLDLAPEVNNVHDRGMMAVALHPGFVPDGGPTSWVYLTYTVTPVFGQDWGYDTDDRYSFGRLTRYRAITTANGVVADNSSRQVLLGRKNADGTVPDCIASLASVHASGSLRFAADGSLIMSTGDGAHADFMDVGGFDSGGFDAFIHPVTGQHGPTPIAQDLGAFRSNSLVSLSGKVLRIDPENGNGYPSNPFYDGNPSSHSSRIWALGLRNPFRISIAANTGASDPALGDPGVLIIGDVGWNHVEEINVSKLGGENFGWPCREGPVPQELYSVFDPQNPNIASCFNPTVGTLTNPALAWDHKLATALYPSGVYVDENGAAIPEGFVGSCALAGPMYTTGDYPPEYLRRVFVADYAEGHIKTLNFNTNYNVLAVRDFGSQTGRIVSLERHPVTGDIWAVSMSTNQVIRIRHGSNLTPHAVATATPNVGAPPLTVQLNGSLSSDPEQDPITFEWDFDDGSPTSDQMNPVHTYTQVGVYHPVLSVTDAFGLTGTGTTQVALGNSPPFVSIRTPTMGSTYTVPVQLPLFANGVDPEGGSLTYEWSVSLYHAIHVHPGTFTSNQQNVLFDIASSPEDPELLYYEIIATVTDAGGLTGADRVFVYPVTHVKDITGTAQPISSLDVLSPPSPLAESHPDIEVIRDLKRPPVGDVHVQRQFATSHNGDQSNDDWIGYELTTSHGPEFRFVGLEFQEGMHFTDGGWFESMVVEVRQGGIWTEVDDLTIEPDYPFEKGRVPSFDGIGYQTYDLTFVPRGGDAIRLRGDPGGATGFVSCGELRVRAIEALEPGALHDVTSLGSLIVPAANFLRPSLRIPFGGDPSVVYNGTFPPVGSTSTIAEYRTVHSNPVAPAPALWIGYAFQSPRSVSRVVFQEGRELAGAGALASIDVQYRSTAGGAWTSVGGLASTPLHPGANGVNYETVRLDFTTVSAQAIRVIGPPAISGGDLSVGEMRVFGPTPP